MKKLIGLFLFSLYLNAQTIDIYGATATKAAMEELKESFLKDKKEDNINLHIGSSGKGYAQYTNGMKFDMFFQQTENMPNLFMKMKKAKMSQKYMPMAY